MQLPIQARPVTRKLSISKLMQSILVQDQSLRCSTEREVCVGSLACCPGLKCMTLLGDDYGTCYRPGVVYIPEEPSEK